jgi:hypothetical protein
LISISVVSSIEGVKTTGQAIKAEVEVTTTNFIIGIMIFED